MITVLISKSSLGLTIVECDLGELKEKFSFDEVFTGQEVSESDLDMKIEKNGLYIVGIETTEDYSWIHVVSQRMVYSWGDSIKGLISNNTNSPHIKRILPGTDKFGCDVCHKHPYNWKIVRISSRWLLDYQYTVPGIFETLAPLIVRTKNGKTRLSESRELLICNTCKELLVDSTNCTWDNGNYRKKSEEY